MDETRWLRAASPLHLLAYLRQNRVARTKSGRRKLRLFACACCRRFGPALREPHLKIISAVEEFADGTADRPAMMRAFQEAYPLNLAGGVRTVYSFIMSLIGARPAIPTAERTNPDPPELREMLWRLTHTETWQVVGVWRLASSWSLTEFRWTPSQDEGHVQADLVRCLFGNPFRPQNLDPSWQTATTVGLARGIHEENDFDRLPILADALEDAGCTDAAVLAHCRADAVHARGCHVVDALLGR